MTDPWAPRRVCVTIKVPESKKYAGDNPWLVFEGDVDAVKEMIAQATGVPNADDLTLLDIAINGQRAASGLGHVAHGLGGTVLANKPAAPAGDEAQADVWKQAAAAQQGGAPAQEEQPAQDPILAALDNAKTVAEVQQIWAENQGAFAANSSYMDAYKARGKALSAG